MDFPLIFFFLGFCAYSVVVVVGCCCGGEVGCCRGCGVLLWWGGGRHGFVDWHGGGLGLWIGVVEV